MLGPAGQLLDVTGLAEGTDLQPKALSLATAAGYCTDHVGDPITEIFQPRVPHEGLEAVCQDASQIRAEEPLVEPVLAGHHGLWGR